MHLHRVWCIQPLVQKLYFFFWPRDFIEHNMWFYEWHCGAHCLNTSCHFNFSLPGFFSLKNLKSDYKWLGGTLRCTFILSLWYRILKFIFKEKRLSPLHLHKLLTVTLLSKFSVNPQCHSTAWEILHLLFDDLGALTQLPAILKLRSACGWTWHFQWPLMTCALSRIQPC